ncbi:MAG TPA: Rap1a/Tai family immunity protein [Motiliproteus sp.]
MRNGGILVLTCCLLAGQVGADAESLLQRCRHSGVALAAATAEQRSAVAYCYGLLQGVRDLNRLYEIKSPEAAYFCLGNNSLSHSDAAALVVDYLERTPKARLQSETTAAVRALRERFPCP